MSTMAQYNNTAIIVDDRDPSIVYSDGWLRVATTAEYDHTKTGAQEAGMTATFVFNGQPMGLSVTADDTINRFCRHRC